MNDVLKIESSNMVIHKKELDIDQLRIAFFLIIYHKLKLKIDRCKITKHKVEVLCHVVSDKGVLKDPEKVRVIETISQCGTRLISEAFLGLAR